MENLFEYYIETNTLHLKYAKGEPAVKEQEFHDYNEFVFFIKGKSFFISKNIQQELVPGSIVVIPKEHFHQFCVTHPENYVRCILGFRELSELSSLTREVMNTVKVISVPDTKIVSIFEQLIEITKSELSDEEKSLYIHSSLVQLMIYLKLNPFMAICNNMNLSSTVSRALSIIDEKYTENLSIKAIADLLYVSPSTLAHKFSRELNISLYRYITQKRLSAANELINRGETMAAAALNSGFSDYSCFYRLYKKYYKK
ncbi:MAG: helix-turn-helix domain-containing protein [Clostridia bacterium]|nr:helix-turn-helix domain-containing protein [Clostridia bacterium]